MTIIKKPVVVDSPYPGTPTNSTVTQKSNTSAVTSTTDFVPATTTDGSAVVNSVDSSTSVYATGIAGINSLVDRGVAFRGANVYLTLEEQTYITNNSISDTGAGNALPAGANNQVQFNIGGAFAGDPRLSYYPQTHELVVSGSVTANYYYGNGSQLTGIVATTTYNNSNVVTLLAGFGSNTIATTGNVSAGNVLTSAEVIASGVIQSGTGLSTGGYLSVNGSTDLHDTNVIGTLSVNVIKSDDSTIVQIQDGLDVDGNVTADYFIGNGSQLTGLPAQYGNSNVTTLLASLGANTISGTGNITTTGNISGGFILGNISLANGFPATYGNANVANYLPTFSGNVSAGNISASGNISGNYFVGNGSQLTGISTANTGNVTFDNVNIIGTGNLNLQPSAGSSEYLNIYLTGAADIHVAYGGGSGNVILGTDEEANVAVLQGGNVAIQAGNVAGTKTWTFDTAGNLTLPRGGVVYETNIPDGGLNGNTIALAPSGGTSADQQLLIYPTTNDANHLHLTSGNLYSTELFLGDDNLYVKLANTGNVVVNSNDAVGNTAQWTFGGDGSLTFPGNLVIAGNTSVFGTNASLLQTTDDRPLLALSSGANGAVSSLWVEDVANVGTSNIAAVYANPTVGSGIVRIAVGQNGGNAGPNLWDFDAAGNLTVPGNIIVATGIVGSGASPAPYLSGFSSVSAITISASGNITGGNILTGGLVSATGNVTGNYILGNGSQLTSINAVTVDITDTNGLTTVYYPTFVENRTTAQIARADVDLTYRTDDNLLTVGNVSVTGNITAGNLIGNISITGNVTGTSANVTLVAGAYSTVFDNTGNLTLPGNTFSVNYANNTPVNVVTRVESSWTVPVGNSTQSFTVPINNTYQLWVRGNIPNGIIVYNATVSVSNTNVPVIGQQFAWNYEGGGNILMFTSIPAQIIGTAGAISNAQPAVANTNVFTFGINNTSGNTVTVNYGWIAIS